MRVTRRSLFTAAQWLFAAAVVVYAARALRGQWRAAGDRLTEISPSWPLLALATLIVLMTYLLLIDTWRRVVLDAGETFTGRDAARIWFVSNLGKYVPGKIWSIAAMTVMARQSGVSPLMAAGSSVLVSLVSSLAGIGVVLVAGAQAVDRPVLAGLLGISIAAALIAIPTALPLAGRLLRKATGREFTLPSISASTIWMTAIRSVAAWIAYGLAFQIFVQAILGSSGGATTSYVAVYAASYIIGFLALFAPGGAVVRESAMIAGMLRLGLSGEADALAVAVASRVWLTATELVPGFAYLALTRRPIPRNDEHT